MRCPECAERNSVAARKCEFCGNKLKAKPLPFGLKLASVGVAVALTASVAASYVVPRLVDPEQNLARVAKRLAAGPSSPEQAGTIKKEFGAAVKAFLKNAGDDKAPALTASLQKLLPTSAFEVHITDLPRGLRIVEVDTVLQATGFLVMKTSAGTKVFDLPGFEVFDDAKILNDSAGPVLALLGHTGGPPPHKPILRTYALLPDYISDETEKLVPPLKIDGTARFAKNCHDVNVEFSVPTTATARKGTRPTERLSYGLLKWKDAHYTSDFGASAAIAAARQAKEAATNNGVATANPVAAPNTVTHQTPPTPPVVLPVAVASTAPGKIVVRSFTGADAVRAASVNNARAAASAEATSSNAVHQAAATLLTSDSVLAAVPNAVPAINNIRAAVQSATSKVREERSTTRSSQARQTRQTRQTSSRSKAEITCSGATLRAQPGRGANAMNNFGKGTVVTVLSKEGDWYKVRVNGQEGYIYSSLVNTKGASVPSAAAARIAAAPPAAQGNSSRRRRARRSEERPVLIAEAVQPRKHSRRRQPQATEPILVP